MSQWLPYILGFFVVVITALQAYPYFKLRASKGRQPAILDELLTPAQRREETLLLYFMAPQCGMCRNITPIVDELARQRSDILRIDAAERPDIAREFSVMGTPAFVLLKNGVVDKVKLGGLSRQKIVRILETV